MVYVISSIMCLFRGNYNQNLNRLIKIFFKNSYVQTIDNMVRLFKVYIGEKIKALNTDLDLFRININVLKKKFYVNVSSYWIKIPKHFKRFMHLWISNKTCQTKKDHGRNIKNQVTRTHQETYVSLYKKGIMKPIKKWYL